MLSFPLTIFGSVSVVLSNLSFFNDVTKGTLNQLLGNGQNTTMSIMSAFVTFGIGCYLSKAYNVEGIFGDAAAFASFLLLIPFVASSVNGEELTGLLSLEYSGAKRMFIGIIVAFLAAEISCRITKKAGRSACHKMLTLL